MGKKKDDIDVLVSRYMRIKRKRFYNKVLTPIKLIKTNKK
jgi:hypothetical protein